MHPTRSGSAGLRPGAVLLFLLTALSLVAAGCSSGEEDTAATPAATTGGLAELQAALPTGHAPEWYTGQIEELGYSVTSLRYGTEDRLEYDVRRGERSFRVAVRLEGDPARAAEIEIEPVPSAGEKLADADAPAAADGITPDDGTAPTDEAGAVPGSESTPGDAAHADATAGDRSPAPTAGGAPPVTGPEPPDTTPARTPPRGVPPSSDVPTTTSMPPDDPDPSPPRRAPAIEPPATDAVEAGAPPAEPAVRTVVVPAGTRIPTSLRDALSSGRSRPGDRFTMTVREPVWIGANEVIPRGAVVRGRVAEVEGARRPNRGGRLVLEADAVELGGAVPIDALVTAEARQLEGEDSTREDIGEIAVGAGIGGIIGGILGGGKGALAGILIGGGGTFAATRGEQVELEPDTPLVVELRNDLPVTLR